MQSQCPRPYPVLILLPLALILYRRQSGFYFFYHGLQCATGSIGAVVDLIHNFIHEMSAQSTWLYIFQVTRLYLTDIALFSVVANLHLKVISFNGEGRFDRFIAVVFIAALDNIRTSFIHTKDQTSGSFIGHIMAVQ